MHRGGGGASKTLKAKGFKADKLTQVGADLSSKDVLTAPEYPLAVEAFLEKQGLGHLPISPEQKQKIAELTRRGYDYARLLNPSASLEEAFAFGSPVGKWDGTRGQVRVEIGDGEQPISDTQRAILEEAKNNGTLTPELVEQVLGKEKK